MFVHRVGDALWAAERRLLGSLGQHHTILLSILAYSVFLSIKILELWGLTGMFIFAFPLHLARHCSVEGDTSGRTRAVSNT